MTVVEQRLHNMQQRSAVLALDAGAHDGIHDRGQVRRRRLTGNVIQHGAHAGDAAHASKEADKGRDNDLDTSG